MDKRDTLLVVDAYCLFMESTPVGQMIDSDREAQTFLTSIGLLGRTDRRIAIVSPYDTKRLAAYRTAGFDVVAMNGERPDKIGPFLQELQEDIELMQLKTLIVATADPAFAALCRAAHNKGVKVMGWAPQASMPRPLTDPDYDFRPLEELFPGRSTARVDVRLDYENLHIGLEKRGVAIHPRELINTVKLQIANHGNIVSLVAYADWSSLANSAGYDIQRELALSGVDTRYQISQYGKNSADMRMANDLHTVLDKDPEAADVFVLATGDRDFRPILETVKARGKKVVVIGLKDDLSRDLQQAADDVYYLDDSLMTMLKPRSRFSEVQLPKYAELAMRIAAWFRQQGWKWIQTDKLFTPVEQQTVQRAIAAGILKRSAQAIENCEQPPHAVDMLTFDSQHPLVQIVRYLVDWLPARITHCLHEKGLTYVDTKYLAEGMLRDTQLIRWGVGQTRPDAEAWLNLAASVGLVVKRTQPHPKAPERMITTWWLPQPSRMVCQI